MSAQKEIDKFDKQKAQRTLGAMTQYTLLPPVGMQFEGNLVNLPYRPLGKRHALVTRRGAFKVQIFQLEELNVGSWPGISLQVGAQWGKLNWCLLGVGRSVH